MDGMKISIITTVFNGGKTIERTIKSVLRQTYDNIEYIIVDGKSTDNTLDIIRKYESALTYISEADTGIYNALNKGIRMATGDYIGIINADDYYLEDAIQNVVDCIANDKADIYYGRIKKQKKNGEFEFSEHCDLSDICCRMIIPHPSVFVSRKIYEEYGGFDEQYHIAADFELMQRFYYCGFRFSYVNKILAVFNEGGISTENNELCARETMEVVYRYLRKYKEIKDSNEQVQKMYYACFASVCFHFPEYLYNYLTSVFKDAESGIILWGTGRWGNTLYRLIKQFGITIKYAVDSKVDTMTIWNKAVCFNPNVLKSGDNVIVAIKNADVEVPEGIHYVTLNDIVENSVDEYFRKVGVRDEKSNNHCTKL